MGICFSPRVQEYLGQGLFFRQQLRPSKSQPKSELALSEGVPSSEGVTPSEEMVGAEGTLLLGD